MASSASPKPRIPRQKLELWVASLPNLLVSSTSITKDVSEAVRRGLLRRIGPSLYSRDTSTALEDLVRQNAIAIAALKLPGHVLSHRTALEFKPAEGHLFVTGARAQTLSLTCLTIKVKKGAGPLPNDMPVMGFFQSSPARAYLENLDYTRRTSGVSWILSREEIEARLEEYLQRYGEDRLNELRDQAKTLAPQLDMHEGLVALDEIIGGLLNTRTTRMTAPTAIARQAGLPFDRHRVSLFEALASLLLERHGEVARPRGAMLSHEFQHLAFIDAYFSNYIEGTTFPVSEAKDIAFDNKIPEDRPKDAHDIGGTFELLSDRGEMSISAAEFDDVDSFERTLKHRHETIMRARPEVHPGEFKQHSNRAGNTLFVAPELVRGTMACGLRTFKTLKTPFQRAAFMMFMLSEIHPFVDGNGRLARVMMNAELDSAEEHRILIVTSYRTDYLAALRRLSRRSDPRVYVRMLDRAQELASRLQYDDLDQLLAVLEDCNAFDDSGGIMRLPPVPA
ncbi:MAG: Fic family protein [Myxococcota bacterium]